MTPRHRNRLAIALLIAPLLIGFPLIRDLVRNPHLVVDRSDMVLLFLALPYAAAAFLLATRPRRPGRDGRN